MNGSFQQLIYVVVTGMGGVCGAYTDCEDADRHAKRLGFSTRSCPIVLDEAASPRLDAQGVAAALDISLRRAQTLIANHPRGRRLDGKLTLPWSALADLRKRPGPGRRKGAA